jgi:hypothetical protein
MFFFYVLSCALVAVLFLEWLFFYKGCSKLVDILCDGILWCSLLALLVLQHVLTLFVCCTHADAESELGYYGRWGECGEG